jgi:hypothetical protein
MKWFIVYSLALVLVAACGSGGDSSPSSGGSSIQGKNFTGVWRVSGVMCLNSSYQLTSSYAVAAGSSTYQWEINGNSSTEVMVSSSSCRTNLTSSVVFTETSQSSALSVGNLSFGSFSAAIPTGQGSCSYTFNLTKTSGATITPTTITSSYNNGQVISGPINANYIYSSTSNPPTLLMSTVIQVVGSPTDACFLVFDSMN